MNVVLDQAAEVSVKGESRTDLGTLPSDVDHAAPSRPLRDMD